MRTRLLLLAFLLPATALPTAADWSQTRRQWNDPAEPFRVIDNVYYVGTRELGSWLIATPKGLIVLDGALAESAPQIEKNIHTLGFSIKDVKILLNSHAHFDHSGGLARLKQDSGAILVASAGDKESLENGKYLGSESVHEMDAPPVTVDRIIADGETVTLGGVELTPYVTPGHTRGCTSWSMTVKEADKPHTAIFYCSTTVAANRLYPKEQYPSIIQDYRATFKKLKTLSADVFLSNHQGFFQLWEKRARQQAGGANPFIDPAELQTFVAKSAEEFEADLAKQRASADGLSTPDKRPH